MVTMFSQITVQEVFTGALKTQVEEVHSTLKDMLTKTGHSLDQDQECKCPPFLTDQTISIVQGPSIHGLMDSSWTTDGW